MKSFFLARLKAPKTPSSGGPAGDASPASRTSTDAAASSERTMPSGMALRLRKSGATAGGGGASSRAPPAPAIALDGPRLQALIDKVLDDELPVSKDGCTGAPRQALDSARTRMAQDIRGSLQELLGSLPFLSSKKRARLSHKLQLKPPSSDKHRTLKRDLKLLDRELAAAALEDEVARNPRDCARPLQDLLDLRSAQLALHSPDQQKSHQRLQAAMAAKGAVEAVAIGMSAPLWGVERAAASVALRRKARKAHDWAAERPEYTEAFNGLTRVIGDPAFSRVVRREVAGALLQHLREGLVAPGDHNRILAALCPDGQILAAVPGEPVPFDLPDTRNNRDRLIHFVSTSYPQSLESPQLRARSMQLEPCLRQLQAGQAGASDFLMSREFEELPAAEKNRAWAALRQGLSPEAAEILVGGIPRYAGEHPEEFLRFCASSEVLTAPPPETRVSLMNGLIDDYFEDEDSRPKNKAAIEQFMMNLGTFYGAKEIRLGFASQALHRAIPGERPASDANVPWPQKTAVQKRDMVEALLRSIDKAPRPLAAELFKHVDSPSLAYLPTRYELAGATKRAKMQDLLRSAPPPVAAKHLYGIALKELQGIPIASLRSEPSVTRELRTDGTPWILSKNHEVLRRGTGRFLNTSGDPLDVDGLRAIEDAIFAAAEMEGETFEVVRRADETFEAGEMEDESFEVAEGADELFEAAEMEADGFEIPPLPLEYQADMTVHRSYQRVGWPDLPAEHRTSSAVKLMDGYGQANDLGKEAVRGFFAALLRGDSADDRKLGMDGLVHLIKQDLAKTSGAGASSVDLDKTIGHLRAAGLGHAGVSAGMAGLLRQILPAEEANPLPPSLQRLLVDAMPHLQRAEEFAMVLAACLASTGPQLDGIVLRLQEVVGGMPPKARDALATWADIAAQSSPEWRRALDLLRSEGADDSRVGPVGLDLMLDALPHMLRAFAEKAADTFLRPWLDDFQAADARKKTMLMAAAKRHTRDPSFQAKVLAAHADTVGRARPDGTRIELRTATSSAPGGSPAPTLVEEGRALIDAGSFRAVTPALRVLARRHDDASISVPDRMAIPRMLVDAMKALPGAETSLVLEELCLARPESAVAAFRKLLRPEPERAPEGLPLGRFLTTLCLKSPKAGALQLKNPVVLARLAAPGDDEGTKALQLALQALCLADPALGAGALRDFEARRTTLAFAPALEFDEAMASAPDGTDIDPEVLSRRRGDALASRRRELDASDWTAL